MSSLLAVFAAISEQRIVEAMQRGEFDNLEGAGQKLVFEDDSMVPEDLRMAYKVMKNAGYLPPEILEEKEILSAADLLANAPDEHERYLRMRKLQCVVMRINQRRNRPVYLEKDAEYYEKAVSRVTLQSAQGVNE
ncbi:DnaJ family domain-containing protein [Desulfolutivibrio sp.]|uniref:DnaJ family domain-containing protein n=1 Tax=Desulfolutivibrio sp. TaxID=2773296 RepID=UPI002F96A674